MNVTQSGMSNVPGEDPLETYEQATRREIAEQRARLDKREAALNAAPESLRSLTRMHACDLNIWF